MTLHMFHMVQMIWKMLASRHGNKYFLLLEWVKKTEYQSRQTEHWHIAAWVVPRGNLQDLAGRYGKNIKSITGKRGPGVVSSFVSMLCRLFACEVDVQIGNGNLNYINGYVAKDHDAVDVALGEYVQKNATSSWLATYRLMCKSTPGSQEVAIRLAEQPEFERSYIQSLLYPPQPQDMVDEPHRGKNFSARMYNVYMQDVDAAQKAGQACEESFLAWHRGKEYEAAKQSVRYMAQGKDHRERKTAVVACRYWYELTDGYWGQFGITQLPHNNPRQLLPQGYKHLEHMRNFVGLIEYLRTWKWTEAEVIVTRDGFRFHRKALPLFVNDAGKQESVSQSTDEVFRSDREASEYLTRVASRDLQYRGFREDRVWTFGQKQESDFLLQRRVQQSRDGHEYEMLRQQWSQAT